MKTIPFALSLASLAGLPGALANPPTLQSFSAPYQTMGEIERLDPALDVLLAPSAQIEKLAEGFDWSEGPLWLPGEDRLLFSDVPRNIVYSWREGEGVKIFLEPSGFTGDHYDGTEPGSNGLALDPQGRLTLAQHGDRRIARLDTDGRSFVTLADRYQGRRFNSPNDLCFDRAGNVYFTDPPYGLGRSSTKELEFHGVYRVTPNGGVSLLAQELDRPNGIALSPDEGTLYVANSDRNRPVILAYPLSRDGSVGRSRVLFDGTELVRNGRSGLFDGLKVDQQGNLWATGPGGVLILSPEGRHLGTLRTGQATANCAFGGDGSVLYITADGVLCRVQTRVVGTGFPKH